MKAVIMAGGFGTRLRPLTLNLPKPMVPLGGVPVMEHLVYLLKKNGLTDITALLYFQADMIKDHFKDGSDFGVKMNYVMAQADYGTAGSVKNAQDYLDERFLIISGDVATDFDLAKAMRFHTENKALATMVLSRVENPLAYGVVITNEKNRIARFLEKPSWGQVFSDTINTGIYILEPKVLNMIPEKTEFDFSKDLFPDMLKTRKRLFGYIADGYWRDIGNTDEYMAAHQDLLDGNLKLSKLGIKKVKEGAVIWQGKDTMISPRASFSGTVIVGDGTKIGPRASIFNSVIGKNSLIGREASIRRTVLWDNASVGPCSKTSEAIICRDTVIGENADIEENAIISDHAIIGSGARVKANVKVWPDKVVESGAILSSSLIWGERWSKELFTESKITGIANVEMTPEFAARVGAAYGAMVGDNKTVIVSRDGSRSSRMLTRALIAGLISSGANVAEMRTIPIPVLRYQLSLQMEAGGVYSRISPSGHNNLDIVFFDSGGNDIPVGKTKSIERLFLREDFRRAEMDKTGRIDFPERVIEYYREGFLQALDVDAIRSKKLKIVIDFSFGGASEILPAILGALNVELITINAFPDPDQVNYRRLVSNQASKQLSAIVKSLKADAGFLIGPIAEKLIVFDEHGRQVDSQHLLLKVASLYLDHYKCQTMATPVIAGMGVDEIAKKHGVELERVAESHLAMMDAKHKGGADFVGGTKGGFIFDNFQIGCDAMFTTAKILELMAISGKQLGQVKGTWQNIRLLRKEIPCSWAKKGLVMRRLMEMTARKKRILVDGVRFKSGAMNVTIKPDRYKASFHVQVESRSADAARKALKEYSQLIKKWQELKT